MVVVALAVASATVGEQPRVAAGTTTSARALVPGDGEARPRILYDPGTEPALVDRLDREPYRSLFIAMHHRANNQDDRTLGDPSIAAQRDLTRAAKTRAFQYALDRTVIGGAIVAFPTPVERAAAGDFARDVLLQMFDRSRLAVPAPIGGWDRDISTSQEMVSTAQAFDTLLGAGYDLGADRTEIVRRMASVTQELFENFTDLTTANGYTRLHQNNHRTKSGAAMALMAIALGDEVPEPQARRWFDTGVTLVDDVERFMLKAGDGAYGEGPFYYRFASQNLVPYLAAWERLLGGDPWMTQAGLTIPALAREPQFARTQRWMIDLTLPDGSLAPIDDGNPGRSGSFGALPSTLPTASAAAWRWANAPNPFDTDGNIDLAADAIVAFDDSIVAQEPSWAPTQFYVEGGNAIFRSSWSSDATQAIVLGEHDTASEFGRDRDGLGRYPQSHEHADPGSFLLHAFGERLALDPGYLNFTERGDVNKPEHHNVVLVDGAGPPDYLQASFAWANDPAGRPPAEGQSTIAHTIDSPANDAATVATAYRGAGVTRRFIFGEDRYLVVADHIDASAGTQLTWMLHGNGGGTSGGEFASTEAGGTWTIGGGRLSSGIATSAGTPTATTALSTHERSTGGRATHTALAASAPSGPDGIDAIQLLYPTDAADPTPVVTRSTTAGNHWVRVDDALDDRRVTAANGVGASASVADRVTGGDGLLVVDRRVDGTLRSAWADEAANLATEEGITVTVEDPGSLGIRMGDDTADIVATGPAPQVRVEGLGFDPAAIDGACGWRTDGGAVVIDRNREQRFTVRTAAGNARPAADAGPAQRVDPGDSVRLDGTASCDADGDALAYQWELVSAPAGSAWGLTGSSTPTPTLQADRVGPYRIRLVVTDARGVQSLEQEVAVIAGPQCGDGVDDDLDGLIDTDDPDCDGADTTPPTSTTSTTSPAPVPTTAVAAPGAVPVAGRPRYTG